MVIKLNREQKIYLLKALQAGEIVETELFSTIQALNTPIVQHIKKAAEGAQQTKDETTTSEAATGIISLTRSKKRAILQALSRGTVDTAGFCTCLGITSNVLQIVMVETGYKPAGSESEVNLSWDTSG